MAENKLNEDRKTMPLQEWLNWMKIDSKSASKWYFKRIPKYSKESITKVLENLLK